MVCGLGWDAVRGDLVGLQSCELRTASAQREQIVALLLSKARPKPMRSLRSLRCFRVHRLRAAAARTCCLDVIRAPLWPHSSVKLCATVTGERAPWKHNCNMEAHLQHGSTVATRKHSWLQHGVTSGGASIGCAVTVLFASSLATIAKSTACGQARSQ